MILRRRGDVTCEREVDGRTARRWNAVSSDDTTTHRTIPRMSEEDEYYASLTDERDGRCHTLRGIRTPPSPFSQSARPEARTGTSYSCTSPATFATAPPSFRARNHPRLRSPVTRDSKFSTRDSTRDEYWQQGRPILQDIKWGSITTKLPLIPPTLKHWTSRTNAYPYSNASYTLLGEKSGQIQFVGVYL